MAAALSDIVQVLEKLAPKALAEEWDNVGLQVGDLNQPVNAIWTALDPTYQVVQAACRQNVDLLVTHHPLIFKPLRSIDYRTPVGSIIDLAARNQLAIFAAHTNLDSALGGINDVLAERLGLCDPKPLTPGRMQPYYKLVVYAARTDEQRINRILLPSPRETRKPRVSWPSLTKVQRLSERLDSGDIVYQEQLRIETVLTHAELSRALADLSALQLTEPNCYDVYPLRAQESNAGIGRVGKLESVMKLGSLAKMVKSKLGLQHLKFAGDPELLVEKAAVCSGSGASLLPNFLKSGAQVFISGDLRYHDARDAIASNLGLIDIGHFPSEYLVVKLLAERLASMLADSAFQLSVKACDLETDPFTIL